MNTLPPDISVEVGYEEDGHYITNVHFNKFKQSRHLLAGLTLKSLLVILTQQVNATESLVLPKPGRILQKQGGSSRDLINYMPVDIFVLQMKACPVEDDELEIIKRHLLEIEAEWFDQSHPLFAY